MTSPPSARFGRWLLSHPTGRWLVLAGAVGLLCGIAGAVFGVATDLATRWLAERVAGLPWVATAVATASSTGCSMVVQPAMATWNSPRCSRGSPC